MNVISWIVQGVLAAMFLTAGITKSTRRRDKLTAPLRRVNNFSTPVVRLTGEAELAGGLGLIRPDATGIATVLAQPTRTSPLDSHEPGVSNEGEHSLRSRRWGAPG
jgi:hypothetical protein